MFSKRSREGYLLIENRLAPAMDPKIIAASGKDVVNPTGVFESATITCSHCHSVVVLNPDRTRDRAWCWSCDHYICDACAIRAKTEPHRPMAQVLEEGQTALIRAGS